MGLSDSVVKMGFPFHRAAHAAAKLSLKADPGASEQCLRSAPMSARQAQCAACAGLRSGTSSP